MMDNLRLDLAAYAPVGRFWMNPATPPDTLAGYAATSAPDTKPRGCCLKLIAGSVPFALVKAWTFSKAAQVAGVEDGWAGFVIHGLSTALAMSATLELRCAVSDNLLANLGGPGRLPGTEARQLPLLDVLGLRSTFHSRYGCSDLEQLHPLAERFREAHGDMAFVQASYRLLLRRASSDVEVRGFLSGLEPDWEIQDVWAKICASDEFRRGPGMPVKGPHEPDFPFRGP